MVQLLKHCDEDSAQCGAAAFTAVLDTASAIFEECAEFVVNGDKHIGAAGFIEFRCVRIAASS